MVIPPRLHPSQELCPVKHYDPAGKSNRAHKLTGRNPTVNRLPGHLEQCCSLIDAQGIAGLQLLLVLNGRHDPLWWAGSG